MQPLKSDCIFWCRWPRRNTTFCRRIYKNKYARPFLRFLLFTQISSTICVSLILFSSPFIRHKKMQALKKRFAFFGAADRTWTGTVLLPRDFKSLASAYSATAAKNILNWRRHPDLNRGMKVLQTLALPLGYSAVGAGNGTRTRDNCLGKAVLYQLSYSRIMVGVIGLEPMTLCL